MMSSLYLDTVVRLDWLLEPLEGMLEGRSGFVHERELAGVPIRTPSHEELHAAVAALTSLGVAESADGGIRVLGNALLETRQYRRGVRDAVRALSLGAIGSPVLRICAAIPLGLPANVDARVRGISCDLRAGLVDVIASARERIVLASPFWDEETANDLGVVLERRLEAGVQVDLLGRRPRAGDGWETICSRLAHSSGCRAWIWEQVAPEDQFGTQTFHFKAAIADRGTKAYLGSANFTTGGLRSRMELGVLLEGEPARSVSAIVDAILVVAGRFHPPAPVD